MHFLLGLIGLFAADPAARPALQNVHNLYLLPMGNSLDQYLANRLTATGSFQVVADPQKADAIFTDRIGESLEQRLDELYPPPAKETDKDKEKDKNDMGDAMGKPPHGQGSVSRGRGTVFLVDRNTRSVLWSIYLPVKSSKPDDTNRRADDVVKHLAKSLKALTAPK